MHFFVEVKNKWLNLFKVFCLTICFCVQALWKIEAAMQDIMVLSQGQLRGTAT